VFPLVQQQTVSDLIELAGGSPYLNLDVDMDIAVIVRRDPKLVNKVEAIPFRLDEALKQRHTDADPRLQPMDELLILSETDGDGKSNRREILQSVVGRFERQATLTERAQIVQVVGEVREPGDYPILNTLSIQHLIELAGGFTEAAYTKVAEVHRTKLSEDEVLTTDVLTISLENSEATTQVLSSRDVLRVNRNPGWRKTKLVTVTGEVKFPGTYALRPGEKLSTVLSRAGGVTPEAFLQGAFFTSAKSREHQVKRVGQYFTYLSKGALILGSEQNGEFDSVQTLKSLVETEVTGRVVVDLEGILERNPDADITVESGDVLHVPQKSQLVAVVGEVFLPGDFSFLPGHSIGDYIENAGGLTRFSQAKRTYIIRADGSIRVIGQKGLFRKKWRSIKIEPGDTIVVPVDLAYETGLTRLATFSRVAFESLGSIGILLNAIRR
jgi:protein involved in polysaccharide export with SLBB domain